MDKKVIGYKGLDKDFSCKGFTYEVGQDYTVEGDIELCENGFHFCENPLDVLDFYPLVGGKFALVSTTGDVKKDDKKSVTNKIHIEAELGLADFIEASVKFLWDR